MWSTTRCCDWDRANPGRELHVLELSGAQAAVDAGDAGEVLDRTAQSAYAARARINVRRRLTVAFEHIERVSPELARRLRTSVQTGTYCVYHPKD